MDTETELREQMKATECVFGLVGNGFEIVAADASTGYKSAGPDTTMDKIVVIGAIDHCGERLLFPEHIKKQARSINGTPLTTADATNVIPDEVAPALGRFKEPCQRVGSSVTGPLDDFNKEVVSIIEKYFSTGDVALAASDLKELDSSERYPYFIKCLLSMAMDGHDKEKEMASDLLSALSADVINLAHIADGFFMLLESSDNLAVDIPVEVDVFALFPVQDIVDNILPPSFLAHAKKALPESSKGTTTLGLIVSDGIIIAIDSRVSRISDNWQKPELVHDKACKVRQLGPHLIATMAGHEGHLIRAFDRFLQEWDKRKNNTVEEAASELATILIQSGIDTHSIDRFGQRKVEKSAAQVLLAGRNMSGTTNLYYMDSLGTIICANDYNATGSGAKYAIPILKQGYNNHLTISEGLELTQKAMYVAATHDDCTGGIVTVMLVGKDETRRLWQGDILKHYNAKKDEADGPIPMEIDEDKDKGGPIAMEIDEDKDEGPVAMEFKGRKSFDS